MNIEARQEDIGTSARQLAAAAEPVFIFDGQLPVLVWANAAALAFVGHNAEAGAQLPHLDRSMPALARLRTLADSDLPASGLRTELVFWTPLGARTLRCMCRRATFAFAPEALIVLAVADAKVGEGTSARGRDQAPRRPTRQSKTIKSKSAKARGQKVVAKSRVRSAVNAAQSAAPSAMSAIEPGSAPNGAELTSTIALREIARQITCASGTGQVNGANHRGEEANSAPKITARSPASAADAPSPAPSPKADFLAQIGHEIRTPLNSILGFAEIMREEKLGVIGNARYKTYASDIHESAAHALSLINDLLDLSRIEAGGLQLSVAEIDVPTVAAKAVASLQPIAQKAGVTLSAPAGRPLPKLVADVRSLKQMLLNLLTNALKHTDAGGAVWLTAATADQGGLVIRVQDTGIGMRAEDIPLALEPYAQVGPAERRAGGSGLGLPLTKALAEANGGRLVLERIAGGGLAALLVFPAERVVKG